MSLFGRRSAQHDGSDAMTTGRRVLGPRRAAILGITAAVVTLASVVTGASQPVSAERPDWKGAETFAPVSIGPNPVRCGVLPRQLEARFLGSGIDTSGGPYTVSASGCLDSEANVLFDLEATDTYLRTGDSLRIAPADVALDVNPVTCTATNREPVRFDVAGGTGAYAGASGGGSYDIAFTLPTCPGPQTAVHVWFRGHLQTPTP
jgi:hypothetical protein